MKINKSLDIDLNIISPQQKHIRIHEGDVDSVDILIGVSVDDESVGLDGVTIKYDATINNYLVEQDADGSVVDGKISIPVTQNMAAMSGLLLIDVRMIQSDQILFTQTICATVEKAVVNGSTYIDLDKITINQRMNALEKQMEHVEEIVENFDTSKLIISANRPPSGAPPEINVDLLRVGDTWILSGENIVYKLVEAQYNYQPAPGTEPYHKFTWKSLNERYGVGNTDPPESVTYDRISYFIEPWHFSWLPVPEYFKGDQYKMLIGVDDQTYYICKSASMLSTGVCTYIWREEGGSIDAYTKEEANALLADKENTSNKVEAITDQNKGSITEYPSVKAAVDYIGEIIGAISTLSFEVVQSKPVSDIKTNVIYLVPKSTAETDNVYEEWIYVNNAWELIGTTEIDLSDYALKATTLAGYGITDAYDKTYVNNNFSKIIVSTKRPPSKKVTGDIPWKVGTIWIYNEPYQANHIVYTLREIYYYSSTDDYALIWVPDIVLYDSKNDTPPQSESGGRTDYSSEAGGNSVSGFPVSRYQAGYFFVSDIGSYPYNNQFYACMYVDFQVVGSTGGRQCTYSYTWKQILTPYDSYTKTEIDTMIGDIETALSEV